MYLCMCVGLKARNRNEISKYMQAYIYEVCLVGTPYMLGDAKLLIRNIEFAIRYVCMMLQSTSIFYKQ